LLVEKRTASLEDMLDYIEEVLIPYDITITKKMIYQDILHLYLDLKDIETIFTAITEFAYIIDEVNNLKN
jgi:flagellar biosynthesis component FlhA